MSGLVPCFDNQMSLTVHLSYGTTHITLLETPDTTLKQLTAEVGNVLSETGALTSLQELQSLRLGVLRDDHWIELPNSDTSLEQAGIDEKSILGFTASDDFSYTPISDLDIE